MNTCYRRYECKKRRKYKQQVREYEHASFVPLVLSCTGGAGPTASVSLKRLARSTIPNYSMVIERLWVCFCFALLHLAISCLCSSRSSACHPRQSECCRPCHVRWPGQMGLTDLMMDPSCLVTVQTLYSLVIHLVNHYVALHWLQMESHLFALTSTAQSLQICSFQEELIYRWQMDIIIPGSDRQIIIAQEFAKPCTAKHQLTSLNPV